jgi:hypothetical protein
MGRNVAPTNTSFSLWFDPTGSQTWGEHTNPDSYARSLSKTGGFIDSVGSVLFIVMAAMLAG